MVSGNLGGRYTVTLALTETVFQHLMGDCSIQACSRHKTSTYKDCQEMVKAYRSEYETFLYRRYNEKFLQERADFSAILNLVELMCLLY